MKKEILIELSLTETERILLNMHSFLNIVNVLSDEFDILKELSGSKDACSGSLKVISDIVKSLGEDSPSMITPHQIDEFYNFSKKKWMTLPGKKLIKMK
jgi:hypothetical protein